MFANETFISCAKSPARHLHGEESKGATVNVQRAVSHPFFAVLTGLALFHVGTYLVFLAPRKVNAISGPGDWMRVAEYRWGGEFAETIFSPINQADRNIRPNYWMSERQRQYLQEVKRYGE
jgi:hypothetical protein